jgi:hypothetical protein
MMRIKIVNRVDDRNSATLQPSNKNGIPKMWTSQVNDIRLQLYDCIPDFSRLSELQATK